MDEVTSQIPSAAPPPGVCVPWEEKLKELGGSVTEPELLRREWQELDAAAYTYLWFWVHR